jgi:hypothetical protein
MYRFKYAITLAGLAGMPLAAHAQASFEGTVAMRLFAPSANMDMLYSVKGSRVRADFTAGGSAMYFIRHGDKNEMVMPASKMYMEQSISASMAAGTGTAGKSPKITRTGKKETIAGWPCEHMLVTGEDGVTDACISQGLGTFLSAGNPMAARGRAADPMASLGKLGFPLKVQKAGGETIMQVTKIEKKALADSLFVVPADYTKVEAPGATGRP